MHRESVAAPFLFRQLVRAAYRWRSRFNDLMSREVFQREEMCRARLRDLAKIALSPLHTLLWGVHAHQGVTITALNCGLKEFASCYGLQSLLRNFGAEMQTNFVISVRQLWREFAPDRYFHVNFATTISVVYTKTYLLCTPHHAWEIPATRSRLLNVGLQVLYDQSATARCSLGKQKGLKFEYHAPLFKLRQILVVDFLRSPLYESPLNVILKYPLHSLGFCFVSIKYSSLLSMKWKFLNKVFNDFHQRMVKNLFTS